jgi:hypothetical protein
MAEPTIAANAPINPQQQLAMAMQGYSPQTSLYDQQAQMMAQALQQMGQQGGQNLRTPVALGANLLAEALMRRKYGETMQAFMQSARGDQQRMAEPYTQWLDQQAGGQQGAPAAAPVSVPASATPDASTPPPAPTPQNTAPPQFSPAVLRAIYGEDTHNPDDQRAIAGVILRREAMSGQTPDQVVATGGFEGAKNRWARGATDADLAKVAANVEGAQPGAFDAFYSPGAQAALGRQAPGWDNGKGVDVGGNRFFSGVYMPPPGSTPPSANPGISIPGQPGPAQTGTGGQNATTPSPSPRAGPSPAPGGPAGAPPAAQSPATGGAGGPQIYHQPVAPEEIAIARQMLSNPRTYQQGIAYIQQLEQRTAAPVKPEMSISREGQVLSGNPWDPSHPNPAVNIPGWRGPLPAGWDRGPNNEAVPTAAVKYGQVGQIPGTSQLGQTGPDGQLHTGPQLDFGAPQKVALSKELNSQLTSSPEYQKFTEARSALQGFRGMVQAMAGANNGVLDSAAMDSYLRGINPGASAKNTTVQMVMEHLGLPQEVQSAVLSATGNGYLTPRTLQQMDQAMVAYTAAHAAEAQHIHQSHVAIASQAGIDEKGLGENIGDIPQPMTLHFGGAPSPVQAGASARQTAGVVGGSLANAAANLPTLTPQQAAAAPRGTRFRSADGRILVRN